MKKVTKVIATVILLIAVMIFSVGCSKTADESSQSDYGAGVIYYGCPNSKRVRKLNLFKKKYI